MRDQFSALGYLLRKEFLQIRRNRFIMAIMLIMPVFQLIILAYAADYEIRNIRLHVIDESHSPLSHQLTNQLGASPYFTLSSTSIALEPGLKLLRSDNADLILRIPGNFEEELSRSQPVKIQLLVNAINGVKAGLSVTYAASIIQAFDEGLKVEAKEYVSASGGVDVSTAFLFNRRLNYQAYMVPGIIVMLLTMVGMFVSALNIVREKEIGTIEQINVSPISKATFIAGKLIPFWIIGLFVLTIGLIVARFVFGIYVSHALIPVYLFSAVYLILLLAMGLMISNVSQTQQQAMLVTYFIMMVFILMGGLFTPIASMPEWAQNVTLINPVAYFIKVMRMVVLKGSGLADIAHYIYGFLICGFAMMSLASLTYRKRSS